MAIPRYELPSGVIDGTNTVFSVSVPYRPGTTAVFLNGQLKAQAMDDGWDETNPETGEITLREAPITDDVVQVFFLSYEVANYTPVTRIVGVLRPIP